MAGSPHCRRVRTYNSWGKESLPHNLNCGPSLSVRLLAVRLHDSPFGLSQCHWQLVVNCQWHCDSCTLKLMSRWPILLLCSAVGAWEMRRRCKRRWRGPLRRRWLWGVPGDSPVGLGGGPVRAETLGHHIRATQNQQEQECTQTCFCRACWNGTGTASSLASWNGSCRNMCKYAKNMQLCQKYA